MTSGLQPPQSGAPTPVMGVTGGPGINNGTASIDPSNGALVFHPQPANVVQVRGSTPGAFQVYEYFHTNTDFSRLTLEAQTGGPFIIAAETDPTTVIRGIDLNTAGGPLIVTASQTQFSSDIVAGGNITASGGVVNATTINPGSNVLNIVGSPSASPFSIIFSIGGTQPWAFLPNFAFTPTAGDAYDLGQPATGIRNAYFAGRVHFDNAPEQPNGTTNLQLTGIFNRGTNGLGSINANPSGIMHFQANGADIYWPYWV